MLNSFVAICLFWEYRKYQDLTANLLEMQSNYASYLLIAKQKEAVPCNTVDDDKKFLVVDRSDANLKSVIEAVERKSVKQKSGKLVSAINNKAIFNWPVSQDSFWISSFFGPRRLGRFVKMHTGIDLAALKGTSVKAAASGKVTKACYEPGYGNNIIIEHNRKYKTRYAHLDEILVEQGQIVRRDQKIGTVGDTGFVQAEGTIASHLHFEVYTFNKQVNPILYLPRR